MIDIPAPFAGASKWLIDTHASLTHGGRNNERSFRHAYDGYLWSFVNEAEKLKRHLEHAAETVRRSHGIKSPEFAASNAEARAIVDLLKLAHQQKLQNRRALFALQGRKPATESVPPA